MTNQNVKENGNGPATSPWPPEQLRRLIDFELPFDEAAEVQLALDICEELDTDALETLAGLDLGPEARAAVEQLAYSAALRRHYIDRLGGLRMRLEAGHEETILSFVFNKPPVQGLGPWTEAE